MTNTALSNDTMMEMIIW